MKKFLAILTTFLFSTVLFAAQPFFLQDWIIPEDAEWGTKYTIPPVEGITFEQGNEYVGLVYFKIEPYKQSHADLPTYLVKNKLAGWNMTYAQILKAFKASNEFDVYEQIESSFDYQQEEKGLTYSNVIVAVAKQERSFTLVFSFGDFKNEKAKKTAKPELFSIYYDDISGIYDPLLYWDKNNDREKAILALTASYASTWDFVISEFDCTVRKEGLLVSDFTGGDAKNLLTNLYGIKNWDDLIREVNTSTDWIGQEYDELKALVQKYPDKKPYEIAEIARKDVVAVAHMYCLKTIGDKLGFHGISFDNKLRSMFLLRLGVGAGYITHDEAVQKAWDIAEELLTWYTSYEDFGFHQILSSTYSGSGSNACSISTDSAISTYNTLRRLLPFDDITFYGKKIAGEPVLSIKELSYKPQDEEELFWYKLAGKTYYSAKLEDIPLIEEAIKRYGELKILTTLYGRLNPPKYDNKTPAKEFFEKNYRAFWNQLPEFEQYAIAFSSNLFELNKMFHLDFSNQICYQYSNNYAEDILEESWSIEDGETLVEAFENLEESGHSGAFEKLCNLLDKYPDKTPVQIGNLEKLSVQDVTRLIFVKDVRKLTGSHGIEAWDEGREITIMRWGISCGYITYDKARELLEPVVARIRKNYVSWQDFMAHYIIGRQFYALYDLSYEDLGEKAKEAAYSTEAYIPVDSLVFTGENADKKHQMKIADAKYLPSKEFSDWEKFQELWIADESSETLTKLKQYTQETPGSTGIVFPWELSLLSKYEKPIAMVDFIEKNYEILDSYPHDENNYYTFLYRYLWSLNQVNRPEKFLELYAGLSDTFKWSKLYYYEYVFANYLMMNKCTTQIELNLYRAKAIEGFNLLLNNDVNISEEEENWLIRVSEELGQ